MHIIHSLLFLAATWLHSFAAANAQEDMAIMYAVTGIITIVSGCTFPKSVVFIVQCGDDGTVRNLDSDEGLGLAACTTTGKSTMSCEDSNLFSYPLSAIAELAFACEGPTDASREATVTLQDDTLECAGGMFGMSEYSRTLGVEAVCPLVPGIVTFPMQFQNNQCSEGAEPSLISYCTKGGRCSDFSLQYFDEAFPSDGPCGAGLPLKSFSLAVTNAASLLDGCLWHPSDLSSGYVIDDAPLPNGPLEALYQVVLGASLGDSIYGDVCSFDSPSDISVYCGSGSELVSADLDSIPTCTRVSPQTYECITDANELANILAFQAVVLSVTCRGSTREALALTVDWDPKSMQCTTSSLGSELATVSYNALIWQTCTPLQDYENRLAQQCSPIGSTNYGDLDEFDYFDYFDDFAGELCSITHLNCQGSDQCDFMGKQELGRMKVHVPPSLVDLFCAGSGVVNVNDNDLAGGEGGAVGVPADVGNANGNALFGEEGGAIDMPADQDLGFNGDAGGIGANIGGGGEGIDVPANQNLGLNANGGIGVKVGEGGATPHDSLSTNDGASVTLAVALSFLTLLAIAY